MASLFDASLDLVSPTMAKPKTSIPTSHTHAARISGIIGRGDVVPLSGAKMCVMLSHRASELREQENDSALDRNSVNHMTNGKKCG
ncbi:unnamed protein product [Macrosiphum euphorbiae]|uniref:Uncharacterized protein n=1 Tax=Macrosiphum euphorbiae TaxID=13131 RepID=A0AAV0XKK5_9HEMI|nr:unnamed protein product [Macrosiphum euphorbiae]